MKRIWIGLLVMMLLTAASIAMAEADREIISTLEKAGVGEPVQLAQWGDTAACFAEADGVKRLIVLEKHGGEWEIVIDNPTALIQQADWPQLYLDSDISIYWTYKLSDQEVLRYHSSRGADGGWGPVDQVYGDSGYGESTYSWLTLWDDAHGGEIIRSLYVSDENDNTELVKTEYLPATWLGGDIRLADFDLRGFPTLVDPQYGAWFETDRFFVEASAVLMPKNLAYVKGILKDGALHFLVRNLNTREKHYVIVEYASRREVNLIVSSPLPEDTYLGVENFTDSLWIHGLSVPVQLLQDQQNAGIEYIYNDAMSGEDGGFLFFGDRTVWSDVWENTILYGDHPWDEITRIDWDSLPHNLDEASAQMDAGAYAVVSNTKSTDRLNLRAEPDRDSRSLGKYYNGTPVTVLEEQGDWVHVTVGGQRGWMMKKYLVFGEAGKALKLDATAMPQLFMREEKVKVYAEPQLGLYAYHDGEKTMKIIGVIGNDWYHVWFPATGEYGFVRQSDLWAGNG